MKKYELTQNTITYKGLTLYQIKALRNFGNVTAGELGGFIEKEINLSHYDNAWVFRTAVVFGNAKIHGNALVCDYSKVCGNADIGEDAKVFGFAEVAANVRLRGKARISQQKDMFTASYVGTENGTLTVYKGKEGLLVTRGCFLGTIDEFLAKSAEVHDEKTKREYQLLIEVAKSRILGE